MADMVDCGRCTFESWARGSKSDARWLGAFDPSMLGSEAAKRMDLVGKITASGLAGFIRGWDGARAQYVAKIEQKAD